MNIVSWNIRGLNSPIKVKEVKQFISKYKVDPLVICETRVKFHNKDKIRNKLARGWLWKDNYEDSPRGRIWVGWNPQILDVQVTKYHEQFLHLSVTHRNSLHTFALSAVYGLHTDCRG